MMNKMETIEQAIKILEENKEYICLGDKITNIDIRIKIRPGEIPTVEIYKEIASIK